MTKIQHLHSHTKKNYFYLFLALIIIGLSILRQPMFFLAPRIWAEEGTVYIASILSSGLLHSLIQPHLGYFSLFPNLVTALGLGLFGFNGVAYVTTFLSFLIILMTIFAPLILKSIYWDSKLKIFLIVLFTLILGPEEIWVNSITSQFYFCVFSCFLLLSDTESIKGWRLYYVVLMMLIAALNSVTSIVLLPFYLFNFIKNRNDKLNNLIILILLLGLFIQLISLIHFMSYPDTNRFQIANIKNFPGAFWGHLVRIINKWHLPVRSSIFLLAFFVLYSIRSQIKKYLTPVAIAIYLNLIFTFLSINMLGAPRYAYPVAVLICIFLINSLSINKKVVNLFLQILVAIIFLINLLGFFKIKYNYILPWAGFSTKSLVISSDGKKYLSAFPQGVSIWSINISDADLERYK